MPPPKTTMDYVVLVLVITVATILLLFSIASVVLTILDYDVKVMVNTLTDLLTVIVGALVGFIAGRNTRPEEPK
jgi:hypothetical protein